LTSFSSNAKQFQAVENSLLPFKSRSNKLTTSDFGFPFHKPIVYQLPIEDLDRDDSINKYSFQLLSNGLLLVSNKLTIRGYNLFGQLAFEFLPTKSISSPEAGYAIGSISYLPRLSLLAISAHHEIREGQFENRVWVIDPDMAGRYVGLGYQGNEKDIYFRKIFTMSFGEIYYRIQRDNKDLSFYMFETWPAENGVNFQYKNRMKTVNIELERERIAFFQESWLVDNPKIVNEFFFVNEIEKKLAVYKFEDGRFTPLGESLFFKDLFAEDKFFTPDKMEKMGRTGRVAKKWYANYFTLINYVSSGNGRLHVFYQRRNETHRYYREADNKQEDTYVKKNTFHFLMDGLQIESSPWVLGLCQFDNMGNRLTNTLEFPGQVYIAGIHNDAVVFVVHKNGKWYVVTESASNLIPSKIN
jgi:hypothetical protein